MDVLAHSEQTDHYFANIRLSELNTLARQNLSYTAMSPVVQPWIDNTVIVTMHPTAEAGMPHTRAPNVICMPAYFPDERRKETLFHEYVHIHQRRHLYQWDSFFQKEGWNPILDQEIIPKKYRDRCRLNPDTFTPTRFYAWKGKHIPLPLFEREDRPELRQVTVQWWDWTTGIRQNQPPRSFVERYGSMPAQPEHPRELAAVELAKIITTADDVDSYLRL